MRSLFIIWHIINQQFYIYYIKDDVSSANNCILVIEYANSGNLSDYLRKSFDEMDWDIKLKFAKEIASAVKCLHDNDIIHRDLVCI